MFFNKIIHGTQYYRAPTPLPNEWETDISRFENYGLDAFQIRINWRWNERVENVYDFSDIDRLFELAEKYDRKVIVKFLLECAPQYIFDKYGGVRIGPKGEHIRGGSHGAFYGGWKPCFTNPKVLEAALRFVAKVAERYADNSRIILWNTWNEIRNRPVDNCFCPHCRAAFGRYLQNKFGTIEALNKFYGTAEESFEAIALPAMPHGFWDIYEFKKFKGSFELHRWLECIYAVIRRYDDKRPIMAHVGATSAFQDSIDDVCDDFTVSRAVDFWGTSIPCDCNMSTAHSRMDYMMLNDFLRCVDKNYFVHEVYPGIGIFKYHYDTPFDMQFKLYTALSTGAKGLIYWQYRAERVGHENDCAGLARADGTPREVLNTIAAFSQDIQPHTSLFAKAEVEPADVAIVYDFDSQLLSEIEDSCGRDYCFDQCNPIFHYRNAHSGIYQLLRNKNYAVDYVNAKQPEDFFSYKVLFFPYYNMFDPSIVPYLKHFMEQGGIIIADEGFGLRQTNTWMNPYDIPCHEIMTVRMLERRLANSESLCIHNETVKIGPFKTHYRIDNATEHFRFSDGTPAMQSVDCGRGRLYLNGFSLGYSYEQTQSVALEKLIADILSTADVQPYRFADHKNGIYEKKLRSGNKTITFLFNCTDEDQSFMLTSNTICKGNNGVLEGNKLTVPAMSNAFIIEE